MKTCCVVVIGHVDHGKTALVHALTGHHTDRLPEEKARGLSITPGYAHRSYPAGIVDFVDAPGHADFVSAMVSGATGAQAALIVISIMEGICAQTLEHLRIAELLGIKQAVIAVTKADVLPAADHAEHLPAIQETLSQTAFAGAPLVVCSARSGSGIDALNAALEDLIEGAAPPAPVLQSFLPVDRVFSMPGRGTIVTGTLLGSALSVDDTVTLMPLERVVTLRALQSRGNDRDRIYPNERMAANLRGITQADIPRGAVLCAAGAASPTTCLDVKLNMLGAPSKNLKHMQEIRVLFGTGSEVAQVRLFRSENPKDRFAQLRFRKPVVCFAGQRVILRSLSPAKTIGGAVVIDPLAEPARPNDRGRMQVLTAADAGDMNPLADALIQSGGGVTDVSTIARLRRLPATETRQHLASDFVTLQGDLITSPKGLATAEAAILDLLSEYHLKHPLRTAAPRTLIQIPSLAPALLQHTEDGLVANSQIRRHDTMLALYDHDPIALLNTAQRKTLTQIEDQYHQAGLAPPAPASFSSTDDAAELLQLLIDRETLIAMRNVALKQTLVFHKDTVARAVQTIASGFPPPLPFTTSQARSTLGTSRRVVVPLLEYFDSIGVTLRKDETRHLVAANPVPHTHSPS
ncbi:selenocysteine-specific translation elongation factor [Sulfitobacter sp. HNIBRBA2951]|uniref:selenocysteine-specific translation elongation factor n=1 Tax=Sulfitobacter aquimarinus TaxID=3158557 RepID=UPI0032E039D6